MTIAVPARLAVLHAKERLVKAVLRAVADQGEKGFPVAKLRTGFQRLGVSPEEAQQIENRLVREGILTLEGDVLRIGAIESLRAYLNRSKWMDSPIAAVAPEQPAPLVVVPGGKA